MGSDLAAAVPFYGTQPSAQDAAKIKAPIDAQYGELDTRITDGWVASDTALTEAIHTKGTSTRGSIMAFTMTRHRDTTKPLRKRLGSTRSIDSTSI